MKVIEAAFIGYPVTDIPRARHFYEDILGLKLSGDVHEMGGLPGEYWIEYELGNVTLAISNAWKPSGESGPSLALEVENLDAAVARLKEAKVPFQADDIDTPFCRFALITDPDGNGIIIHKRKS